MKLTDEQNEILRVYRETDRDIAVEAYAGTGKTTTLRLLAEDNLTNNFLYLAFNKDIVEEAKKKMPSNVRPMTLHSAAYQFFAKGHYKTKLQSRLQGGRVKYQQIAETLKLNNEDLCGFTQYQVVHLVKGVVQDFETSATEDIRTVEIVQEYGAKLTFPLHSLIYTKAEEMWKSQIDPKSDAPITHNTYLKAWQVCGNKKPVPADAIMLDEAQDANPVMLAIISKHLRNCRKVFVGDENQMIYGWNGAVNAMRLLEGATRLKLTKTYRFGDNILGYANKTLQILNKENPPMTGLGTPGKPFDQEQPYTLLCRTNATLIDSATELAQAGTPIFVNKGLDAVFNALIYLHFLSKCGTYDKVKKLCYEKNCPYVLNNEYKHYTTFREVEEMAKVDKGFARDVTKARKDNLLEQLRELKKALVLRKDAHVFLSTTHKAKGLEWSQVQLANDFDYENGKHAEWCLIYVGITRAKEALECTWLQNTLDNPEFMAGKLSDL